MEVLFEIYRLASVELTSLFGLTSLRFLEFLLLNCWIVFILTWSGPLFAALLWLLGLCGSLSPELVSHLLFSLNVEATFLGLPGVGLMLVRISRDGVLVGVRRKRRNYVAAVGILLNHLLPRVLGRGLLENDKLRPLEEVWDWILFVAMNECHVAFVLDPLVLKSLL